MVGLWVVVVGFCVVVVVAEQYWRLFVHTYKKNTDDFPFITIVRKVFSVLTDNFSKLNEFFIIKVIFRNFW